MKAAWLIAAAVGLASGTGLLLMLSLDRHPHTLRQAQQFEPRDARLHQSAGPARFRLGGQSACPDRYDFISTEIECMAAAARLAPLQALGR